MGKKRYKFNIDYEKTEEAPRNLDGQPFYDITPDDEQKIFIDSIYDPDTIVTLCDSKAGCGKTLISLAVANIMVKRYGLYEGIVYLMSPCADKLGYLPGNLEDKTAPYMKPLIDAMLTIGLNPDTCLKLDSNIQALKNGTAYIEFYTDTYMRGCNLENKVVIIDEAQNFPFNELKKVLTRVKDSCKVIIIGHQGQCDLRNKKDSGFSVYLDAFKEIIDDKRVKICYLKTNHRGWFSNFCDNVEK